MADKGNEDTFEYAIAGRTMVFRKTSRAQLMMLERMGRQIMAQMNALGPDRLDEVRLLGAKINDIAFETAESRFTDPADLEFVRTEVLRGNVEEEEIFAILANGVRRAKVEENDDADPAPAKRAAKKATKAVAKKAPAGRRGAR